MKLLHQTFLTQNSLTEIKKTQYPFFFLTNLVAKAPGLNLGKKLINLLSKGEALN